MSEHRSFWTSLPAVLTGVAAVITAVATLLGVFSKEKEAPRMESDQVAEAKPAPPKRGREAGAVSAEPRPRLAYTRGIQANDRVLALWEDGCYYRASVLEVSNDRFHVAYEFSHSSWVEKEAIYPLDRSEQLAIGAYSNVLVRLPSPNDPWARGQVEDVSNGSYVVLVKDDSHCVPDNRRIRAAAADIVVIN
jgi:hypothetical protein